VTIKKTKRGLKIGIVVDQLLEGGVQKAAIEQVKEINKLGHKAKLLILMRKKYPTDFSYLVKGVPHQYLSDAYPPPFRKTVKFPIFSFLSSLHLASPVLAPGVIEKDNYDILVSWGTTTSLTTQAIFRRLKIPYVAIIHDPIIYILEKVYSRTHLKYFFPILYPLAKYFESSFVKDAAKTIIISNVHFNYLKRNYGTEAEILPLGVKAKGRIPKRRGNSLLSFGRWQKEKNPQFLLNLVKQIPNSKLIVAGTWIEKQELNWFKNKIKKEKLERRVAVIPHYSDKELTELCAKARLFFHPHFEAFGLAALEAASHGLPIIFPEKSGVTEKFVHGVHGYFPKKINLKEYKKYTKRLLASERLAYKMGRAAAKVVRKEFSWESNTKNLLNIINLSLGVDKKAKIAVLETGHAPGTTLAGGDKLMEPMAQRLSKNYQFSIIVSHLGAKHWKEARLQKEMIILSQNRFDKSSEPVPVFLTYCLRMLETTKILKKKKDTDIIYSSTNILPDVLPSYFARKRHNYTTWVARIHHLIPPPHAREGRSIVNRVSYLMQSIALFMIKTRADIIIALNEQLYKELLNKGFPKKKLKVLGAGIDFEKIDSQKVLPDTKSYQGIFLGRLHPTKGIFDLVPIWKKVVKDLPKAKLAVIGESQEYISENLQKEIERGGLSKNVSLLGYLPDGQVYSLMKKACVFLFTDHEAGWGLAVAEAMAAGLPVVGYDIGILGTVYKKGYKKVSVRNYKKFAKEVKNLLKNNPDRIRLSREALKEAARLDWSLTTEKFRVILE